MGKKITRKRPRTTTKRPRLSLLSIRVTDAERVEIVSAAKKSQVTMSSWLREVAVYAAKHGYSVKTSTRLVST